MSRVNDLFKRLKEAQVWVVMGGVAKGGLEERGWRI
jgi:hypothetical protein